jgi:DNA polymerase-3 subunit epsilon/exodeoxyribonuclease X
MNNPLLDTEPILVLLDTETTGIGENDRLIEVCYRRTDTSGYEYIVERFKPPVKISIESMVAHGIREEDVADKPFFHGSSMWRDLKDMFEENAFVVCHNAPFDVKMLNKEGLFPQRVIDTLQVSKHLLPNLSSYSLQYLRYSLPIKLRPFQERELKSHSAYGDVMVLNGLYRKLYGILYDEGLRGRDILEKMILLSNSPIRLSVLPWGKYKGKTFEEVKLQDKGYWNWLRGVEDKNILHTITCIEDK